MSFTPSGNTVLVKVVEPTQKGKIVVPENAQEEPNTGEVVAVGRGRYLECGSLIAPPFAVGDKVLFYKGSGVNVKVDDNKLKVVQVEDILGVFTNVK